MPLHPDTAAFVALVESLGDPPLESTTPSAARSLRESRNRQSDIVVDDVRDIDAAGVPCRLYRPANSQVVTGLTVFFHGGGWVMGSIDGHDDVCRSMCVRSGHSVLSVGYRLAPEHPYPAALTDALDVTRWACEHAGDLGIDRARIAVGGDSAGGNIAAVVAQLTPVPLRFQLLIYPVTDARAGHPSYAENHDGPFLTAPAMQWFIDHYLSGDQGCPDDPMVSPLLASDDALAATPPAMVITAEFDPLRDEGVAYADKLADAGVPTSHQMYSGQIHAFFSNREFIGDASIAHAAAGEALARALAP